MTANSLSEEYRHSQNSPESTMEYADDATTWNTFILTFATCSVDKFVYNDIAACIQGVALVMYASSGCALQKIKV